MEIENRVTVTDKIKKFVKNNYGVIITSGVVLTTGYFLAYKNGLGKGIRRGRNNILDEIMLSCEGGLMMTNPDLGRYVFTVKKLENVKN